jgi:N-acetylgalactosamine kinase
VFVSARREDDTVRIANVDKTYPDRAFSIAETLALGDTGTWLSYLTSERVITALQESKGDWCNYVKSAVLRAALHNEYPLCGMDMMASGNIPVAAGLSSSSGIVVAVMEAVNALNCLNLPERTFIDLCGEGEWFVGSRGGAGDHAAMKCAENNTIVHLDFKPFAVGARTRFSDEYAVLVANSMQQAKKSEGSRDTFNEKVACYEFALMLLRRSYPQYDLKEFRDVARIRPYRTVYEMLRSLPETITRGGLKALLPDQKDWLEGVFATHKEPLVYELRGVALYGVAECARAEAFTAALQAEAYEKIGDMMKWSHAGDRADAAPVTDELLDRLIAEDAPFAEQIGAYRCSTENIDVLCDLLNTTDGVLGSELVGAGLGGCVVALVKKSAADAVIEAVNAGYYDRLGYPHAAQIYSASCGSSVMF